MLTDQHRLEWIELPFLYPDLGPIRGRIKSRPEDFVVDEVPAYELSGEGDHLYVRIRKTGWPMEALLKHLEQTLELRPGEISYAGMKDKVAITTQWLSMPPRCEPLLEKVDCGAVSVLEVTRHGNKLRTGHLKGNNFRIVIRGGPEKEVPSAEALMQRVSASGMLNSYGRQRFGKNLEAARVGLDVVKGTMNISGMSRMKRKFCVSAIQSYLFNLYLQVRIKKEKLRKVVLGDILKKTDTGGMFIVEDPLREQRRLEAGEVIITGPIFGKKMTRGRDEAHSLEMKALGRLQLSLGSFDAFHTLGSGTRRPLLSFPQDAGVEHTSAGIEVRFFLPKGTYATELLRELTKREV